MAKITIHTGLYTESAKTFFDVLKRAIHNHYPYRVTRNTDYAEIVVNPDGEVIIEGTYDEYYRSSKTIWNKFRNNERKIREWFAIKLKEICRRNFDSDAAWSRLNNDKDHNVDNLYWYDDNRDTHYFNVAEAYFIYDILLNRKNLDAKYEASFFKKFVGQQKDPLKAEAERLRRIRVKEAEDRYNAELQQVYNIQQEKIQKARAQFQAEADAEREKLKSLYEAELAEINRKVENINKLNGSLFAGFAA